MRTIREFWSDMGQLWCRAMHSEITWPMCGYYRCRTCWRKYPIPWANREPALPPPAMEDFAVARLLRETGQKLLPARVAEKKVPWSHRGLGKDRGTAQDAEVLQHHAK